MTSDRKFAANRINAKKSTGPTTSRGKSRASANAWRHGWSVAKKADSTVSADVERMAKAICGDEDPDPAQYEQALIIAEYEIVLLNLRAARIAAIRRNRIIEPTVVPAHQLLPGFPTEEEWAPAFAALERGRARPATKLFTRAAHAILAADAKLAKAKTEHKSPSAVGTEQSPLPMANLDGTAQVTSKDPPSPQLRSDVEAFKRALPELITLDRYERRIMSRRQRAIRMFEAMSVVGPFLYRPTKGTE
jgi:hypothetical protein